MAWDERADATLFSASSRSSPTGSEQAYIDHYGAIDLRRKLITERADGKWVLCHEQFDERYVSQSPVGARYSAVAKLGEVNGVIMVLGVHRGKDRGPFDSREMGLGGSSLTCSARPVCTWNLPRMAIYAYTEYFEKEVLRKRPYLKKEWCAYVLENAVRSEPQEHNRFRYWAPIAELGGRYLRVITLEDRVTILRVITLEDRVTIHNAFPDRDFNP
ncbi:MAG: hypothetical protein JNL68_16750 [Burkholderiales bacterium]|nr:hypothetical protein [Burkholderiales bacterium]